MSLFALRFATSWQRSLCHGCREETNHYKNKCVHCGELIGAGPVVTVTAQYNGRGMVSRLSEDQRAEARRMLNAGTPPKIISAKLRISPATIYRLNPLTRG